MGKSQKLGGALYVRINWFHRKATQQDVDNIAKNLLDGMKAVVFDDDYAITKLAAHRIDASGEYQPRNQREADAVYQELLLLLGDPAHDHVLYIEVGEMSSQAVTFGPIDEDSA
jgi:hypothetical protein